MTTTPYVEAISQKGIVNDRHFKENNSNKCQITLIEIENINYYNQISGTSFLAKDFRRNIITKNIELNNLIGKKLVTHQTGSQGRTIKRLYLEETCDIKKEFYLSCLVDRASSKIAFITSAEGGMDIEKVAKDNPEKIITTKIDLTNEVNQTNVEKIIKIFQLDQRQKIQAKKLINSICPIDATA